ncbi:NADH-quinone oxidoreductase subunit H [Ruminiclostridium herbifermentans]|uniref:NADH-quinone oxidoreductase subunit H n=1 Tax=Ruminiclostridium herbifermentans TaxID=2488810 RepID=A0A4U7J898_9FIRM|nr:complex I subunit 1 family protein [Ruminiclostridium herbifermentans]QNU66775.1 NADH-quinone oxidoreductase subunit H [Ruminiclostridium herbifermentans]
MSINNILIAVIAIIAAPIIGGLLTGIDRKITARMQNRQGPPILQPFYDFFKLIGKQDIAVNQTQMVYVLGHLLFAIGALVMLVLQQDLLMIMFILAFSGIALIMGASSIRSPYSKIGAQREIMSMMAYEPVLLLMVVGVYKATGSFMISGIFEHEKPLLFSLPLVFLSFLFILTIKLRKSPFDFATSHHGHQELIKGLTTEFSGTQLALIELTDWIDLVLFMGLISLFFAKPIWVGILIALVCYFLEILIDNISARMTWQWMVKTTWVAGIGVALVNIIWMYLI